MCKAHARGEGVKQSTILAYAFFFTFRNFFVSTDFGFILLLFCVYIFCALEYKAKSNTDVMLNSNSDYFLKHGSTNNSVWKMVDVHFLMGVGGLEKCAFCTL